MKTSFAEGRRPFWLPASNYYVLSFSVSTAFFFVVWGIQRDGGDDMPWATAGISASIILITSVVLRELILRRARRRLRIQQRPVSAGLAHKSPSATRNPDKLTLERNAAILLEIQKKSDAANVLNRISGAHREVFELCSEYIARNEFELKSVSPSSPRLAALLRGRSAAAEFHRYHLLKWAQIEVHALTNEVRTHDDPQQKKLSAKAALGIIDTALGSYPNEESLIDSQTVLLDMVVSINISEWIDKAERAAFDGEYDNAREFYNEALFYLGRDNIRTDVRELAAQRIIRALERLRTSKNRG